MARPANIRRQLAESSENLYINKWWTGLVTNRSPLFTPVSALGIQVIARHDTLADGLNTELSPTKTVVRRPGFPNFCSVAFTSSDYPLGFYSYKTLAGTLYPVVDAPTAAYIFGASSLQAFYPKGTAVQSSFQRVGQMLYVCDGNNANKWDGTFNWVAASQNKFANTSFWSVTGGTATDNNVTDPNSVANNASKYVAGTGTSLYQDIAGVHPKANAVLPITFSIYMKIPSGGPVNVTLQIKSGTALNSLVSTAESVTTSWQRFQVTATPAVGEGGIRILISPPNGQELHVWGAQVELNSAATTYVATTGYVCPLSTIGIVAPTTAPSVSAGAGSLSPAIGYNYVYCFKNSRTGHYSTASPPAYVNGASTGAQTSKQFTIGGANTADPQCDVASIFRTYDGGSIYFYLADVTLPVTTTPPDVLGRGTAWTYVDNNADTVLNVDLQAPLAHSNDAILQTANLLKFHQDRLFAAVNNKVYFAGGPDVTTGVGDEAWPPANVFEFPDAITAMTSTPRGLLVFSGRDAYIIQGQSTGSFWAQVWQHNFGVKTQNCVAQDGDVIFIYTTRQQLFSLGDSLEEIGYPIADQLLASFPAGTTRLAVHRNGADHGLFVSNGTDTILRFAFNSDFNAWCPFGQPVGGIMAIGSVETSDGIYTLCAGRTAGSGQILGRAVGSFFDGAASNYAAYATIGSLILAPPGQTALIENVITEVMPVGTYPTIALLGNEVSGSFIALPAGPSDPPNYSGTAYASSTVLSKRHPLKGAASPIAQQFRHLRLKVTFATEAAKNELLGLAIQ